MNSRATSERTHKDNKVIRPQKDSGADRLIQMLATALGEVGDLLLDETIVELMLNPDGRLWQDRLGEGRRFTGYTVSPADAERVIYIVANSVGAVCNKDVPLLSAELPVSGARFQGILPPVVTRPVFTIRKKALQIFSLNEYVTQGILTAVQRDVITHAVQQRKNILIVGGTGSGKTTLANAILDAIAACHERVIIMEDTQELQCRAEDVVQLRTRDGVTMTDLLKATLRLRPDRIVIGEVRGGDALRGVVQHRASAQRAELRDTGAASYGAGRGHHEAAEVYETARARNPRRWSGDSRDWSLPQSVWLNPEKTASPQTQAA